MAKKTATTPKTEKPQAEEVVYSLPEYGLAVLASSVEEAVAIAKAELKQSKEKIDV